MELERAKRDLASAEDELEQARRDLNKRDLEVGQMVRLLPAVVSSLRPFLRVIETGEQMKTRVCWRW